MKAILLSACLTILAIIVFHHLGKNTAGPGNKTVNEIPVDTIHHSLNEMEKNYKMETALDISVK